MAGESFYVTRGALCKGLVLLATLLLLFAGCLPRELSSPSLFLPPLTTSSAPASPVSSGFTFVSSNPPNGLLLGVNTPVQITFSQPVVSGCTAGGTLGGAPFSYSYSGNTVTVTPGVNWTGGIGMTLDLTGCQDSAGNTTVANLSFQVPNSIVYISATGNDITGAGTKPLPWKTVNKAVTACPSPPCVIYASGGLYTNLVSDSVTGGTYALIGGYDSTYSTYDPATYKTRFSDGSGNPGAAGNPTFAFQTINAVEAYIVSIEFEAASGAQIPVAIWISGGTTILQGIKATGCTAACGTVTTGGAIYLSGAANLLLAASKIDAGQCSAGGCKTYGIYDGGAGAQTFASAFSTINGGTAAGTSCGLYFNMNKTPFAAGPTLLKSNVITGGTSTTPCALYTVIGVTLTGDIERNFFYGGNGTGSTIAMRVTGFTNAIRSNIIHAGASSGGTTTAFSCNAGCTGLISNNVIDAGYPAVGSLSEGITGAGGGAGPDIRNNLFTGWSGSGFSRNCIYFMGNTPSNVMNNGFYNCNPPANGMGTSYDTVCVGGALYTAGCGTALPSGGNSGNVISAVAPGWVNPAALDYHFRSDGTALCSLTQGGLPLVAGEQDASFVARTAPWSMGPYEYDGPCQ